MSGIRQFRISEWAIRNPIPITVLFVLAVLAGGISLCNVR